MPPLTPAQEAQGKIDAMLEETGWQDKTRKRMDHRLRWVWRSVCGATPL